MLFVRHHLDVADLDVAEDYELEVEEFDLPSEQDKGTSTTQDEDDWIEKYEEERQREKIRFETLEKCLDGRISTSDW